MAMARLLELEELVDHFTLTPGELGGDPLRLGALGRTQSTLDKLHYVLFACKLAGLKADMAATQARRSTADAAVNLRYQRPRGGSVQGPRPHRPEQGRQIVALLAGRCPCRV